MIKVPSYTCSYEHGKSETARFMGKHEVPLFRSHIVAQRPGIAITVTTPPSGLPPDTYWCAFASVDAEYLRLRGLYGPGLDRVYPVLDELRSAIESELERVARNKGVNPNAPKEIVADAGVVALLERVAPVLPKGAKQEEKAARKASAEKTAVELHLVGIASVKVIASTSLTQLCLAPSLDPSAALALRDAANEDAAKGNEREEGEARNLDLGALVGRDMGI
jgi:hypothetical protein